MAQEAVVMAATIRATDREIPTTDLQVPEMMDQEAATVAKTPACIQRGQSGLHAVPAVSRADREVFLLVINCAKNHQRYQAGDPSTCEATNGPLTNSVICEGGECSRQLFFWNLLENRKIR